MDWFQFEKMVALFIAGSAIRLPGVAARILTAA
jgi:hypothetical protein